jgi:hypothetical protein
MKKHYTASRMKGISYVQGIVRRLTVLVTSFIETAFKDTLLKERWSEV